MNLNVQAFLEKEINFIRDISKSEPRIELFQDENHAANYIYWIYGGISFRSTVSVFNGRLRRVDRRNEHDPIDFFIGAGSIDLLKCGASSREFFFKDGGRRGLNTNPQLIQYYDNGVPSYKSYYDHEKCLAVEKFFEDGTIQCEIYRDANRLLSPQEDTLSRPVQQGPAKITYYQGPGKRIHTIEYYENNRLKFVSDDIPSREIFSPSGEIIGQIWGDGSHVTSKKEYIVYHRVGGPAKIIKHEDGSLAEQLWAQNGHMHRIDLPAYLKFSKDGQIISEEYRINGVLHRIGGPALTEVNAIGEKKIIYSVNGKASRPVTSGPAVQICHPNGKIKLEKFFDIAAPVDK